MRRRIGLVGLWLAVTAGATALAWGAVGLVTAQVAELRVVPRPPPARVVAADPTPGEPPRPAATRPADPPAGSPGVVTTADQSQPGAPLTRTYELVGGTVTVRFAAGASELQLATPRAGFTMDVREDGPDVVDVRFAADEHESRLEVLWAGGQPVERIEERPG